MECNREEALKAKAIAEKKFIEIDITGAKRFALKAHSLYPNLDGLPQLLATLDIYISSQKRTNGEIDWYEVLGVEPSADDETIRKQYRKLALILHPDKNKSVGAKGAFKILSDAWSSLSDKAKRIAYDQNCNIRHTDHDVPTWKSSMPTGPNGFNNRAMHMDPPGMRTFWTTCSACRTHFEYFTEFVNHSLLCQNCHQPFIAVEMMAPPQVNDNAPTHKWNSYMHQQNHGQQTRIGNLHSIGPNPISVTNMGLGAQPQLYSNLESVKNVQSAASSAAAPEKLKRNFEEATITAREELFQRRKYLSKKRASGLAAGSSHAGLGSLPGADKQRKRPVDNRRKNNSRKDAPKQKGSRSERVGHSGLAHGAFEAGRIKISGNSKLNWARDPPPLGIQNLLEEKAKKSIHDKLKRWSTVAAVLQTLEKKDENEKEKQEATVNGVTVDASKCPESANTKPRVQTRESFPVKDIDDLEIKAFDALSMSVPDPDFHDFDNDRAEKSFGDNQVWAAYDDDDGMPRYYAMIHSVISRKPFKMRISWLNSKSNRELGPLNWIGSGFYKTSGEFWVGKHEGNNSLNSFSHKVTWTKGVRGAILIYPGKGEVWAVYKNWSPDWNALTSDEVIHKYEMVEVLEDYREEMGVIVAPLIKVAGFKTVFHRHPDPSKTRTIPREEMFRLSHQVPACWLTGQEGSNAPKGCWELDPASMPLELLQVCTKAQLEQMLKASEEVEGKDRSGGLRTSNGRQSVVNDTTEGKAVVEDAAGIDSVGVISDRVKGTKECKLLVYKRRKKM